MNEQKRARGVKRLPRPGRWAYFWFFIFFLLFILPQLWSEKSIIERKLEEMSGWSEFIRDLGFPEGTVPLKQQSVVVEYLAPLGRLFWMPKFEPTADNFYFAERLVCAALILPIKGDEIERMKPRFRPVVELAGPLSVRNSADGDDAQPERFVRRWIDLCGKQNALVPASYEILGFATLGGGLGPLMARPTGSLLVFPLLVETTGARKEVVIVIIYGGGGWIIDEIKI